MVALTGCSSHAGFVTYCNQVLIEGVKLNYGTCVRFRLGLYSASIHLAHSSYIHTGELSKYSPKCKSICIISPFSSLEQNKWNERSSYYKRVCLSHDDDLFSCNPQLFSIAFRVDDNATSPELWRFQLITHSQITIGNINKNDIPFSFLASSKFGSRSLPSIVSSGAATSTTLPAAKGEESPRVLTTRKYLPSSEAIHRGTVISKHANRGDHIPANCSPQSVRLTQHGRAATYARAQHYVVRSRWRKWLLSLDQNRKVQRCLGVAWALEGEAKMETG